MPIDWNTVSLDMKASVDEIKARVKHYNYSDTEASLATDERFIEFLQDELRKSKARLYDITDVSFGRNITLTRDFQNLRDELDIFLDEIKLRHCEWKALTDGWIKKIIGIDLELIRGIGELNARLEKVLRKILDFRQVRIKDHAVVYEPDFWKDVEADYAELKGMIDGLVILFKERETVCNIRKVSLEKTFRKIEKEMKEKYKK